jgi:hypothetical protein
VYSEIFPKTTLLFPLRRAGLFSAQAMNSLAVRRRAKSTLRAACFPSSIKYQSDPVMRETCTVAGMARSNRDATVRFFPDSLLHFRREHTEAAGLEPHDRPSMHSRYSCVRIASFPGILGGTLNVPSACLEQRPHLLFLLLQREFRKALRKIFNGKEPARAVHHRDAHFGGAWIKNIPAVPGRIHPSRVDDAGIFADADVFRDESEARAGIGQAFFETGLAGKLVLEAIEIEHAKSMLASGLEEGVIPAQFGEIVRGALGVEQLKDFVLGFVALERLRLRIGRSDDEKQERNRQTKRRFFHAGES